MKLSGHRRTTFVRVNVHYACTLVHLSILSNCLVMYVGLAGLQKIVPCTPLLQNNATKKTLHFSPHLLPNLYPNTDKDYCYLYI